jgi:hypothetical protein
MRAKSLKKDLDDANDPGDWSSNDLIHPIIKICKIFLQSFWFGV